MLVINNNVTPDYFRYKIDLGLNRLIPKYFSPISNLKLKLNISLGLFSINRDVRDLIEDTVSQLFLIKGVKSEIELRKTELSNTDLSVQINSLSRIINQQVLIHNKIEKIIDKSTKFPIKKLDELLTASDETLSVLYDIQRLLKKLNLKPAMNEQSDIALSSIRRSQKTLQAIYG